MWFPGYTNTKGNDMPDKLPHLVDDMHFIGPNHFFDVSKWHLHKKLQDWETKETVSLKIVKTLLW